MGHVGQDRHTERGRAEGLDESLPALLSSRAHLEQSVKLLSDHACLICRVSAVAKVCLLIDCRAAPALESEDKFAMTCEGLP